MSHPLLLPLRNITVREVFREGEDRGYRGRLEGRKKLGNELVGIGGVYGK